MPARAAMRASAGRHEPHRGSPPFAEAMARTPPGATSTRSASPATRPHRPATGIACHGRPAIQGSMPPVPTKAWSAAGPRLPSSAEWASIPASSACACPRAGKPKSQTPSLGTAAGPPARGSATRRCQARQIRIALPAGPRLPCRGRLEVHAKPQHRDEQAGGAHYDVLRHLGAVLAAELAVCAC